MNYVSLEVIKYAASIMQALREAPKEANVRFVCEHQSSPGSVTLDCQNRPEYLLPDATRVSAGGDIERKPMFLCGEHTAEIVGEEPQEQPIFRRIVNPDM